MSTSGSSQSVVPEPIWEQDVADGGAVENELPPAAVAVVVQGVSLTREAPSLAATFGTMTITNGTAVRIGRNPRRRRLLLSVRPNATATAFVVIGESQQQVTGNYGLSALQGVTLPPIQYAGEIWVAASGADMQVGFMAELDQG